MSELNKMANDAWHAANERLLKAAGIVDGERVKQALDAMSENWRKHPLEWPNGCEVREFDGLIGLYDPGAKQPRVWMSKTTAKALGLWEPLMMPVTEVSREELRKLYPEPEEEPCPKS